jgi:hypothetical protein
VDRLAANVELNRHTLLRSCDRVSVQTLDWSDFIQAQHDGSACAEASARYQILLGADVVYSTEVRDTVARVCRTQSILSGGVRGWDVAIGVWDLRDGVGCGVLGWTSGFRVWGLGVRVERFWELSLGTRLCLGGSSVSGGLDGCMRCRVEECTSRRCA